MMILIQVSRVRSVIADGVREIWLSSEDTGAYGICLRILFMPTLFLLWLPEFVIIHLCFFVPSFIDFNVLLMETSRP